MHFSENVKHFEGILTEPTQTKGEMLEIQLSGKTYQKGEFTLGEKNLARRTSQDFQNKMQRNHQHQ